MLVKGGACVGDVDRRFCDRPLHYSVLVTVPEVISTMRNAKAGGDNSEL